MASKGHSKTRKNKFNRKENAEGKYIQYILGSSVISEGLTFNCCRYVHIFEPFWNNSKNTQIVGRIDRYQSHNFLPEKDRNYSVTLYLSQGPESQNTIDYHVMNVANLKDKQINMFVTSVMLSYPIDRENVIDTQNNIQIFNPEKFIVDNTYDEHILSERTLTSKAIKNITYNGKKFEYNSIIYFIKMIDNSPLTYDHKINGEIVEIIPLFDYVKLCQNIDVNVIIGGLILTDDGFKMLENLNINN